MPRGVLVAVLAVPASVVVLAVIYAVRLYSRQQSIVFRPRAESTNRSPIDFRIPYRDVMLECAGGIAVHCWWVSGRLPKTIVYFHGSDGNLSYELPTLRFLAQLGANLLLIDYPGYGRSGGRCSERLCYEAGDAAWTYVHDTLGVATEDIVLFGQSLGTAVATYVASAHGCGGLVFQSGFESVPAMASELFPFIPSPVLWAFARTRMNSLRRIADCRCPILVLHSPGDEHIPITQARRIYARAPGPKRFVELRGVHFSGEWRRQQSVLEAWQELIGGDVRAWEAA